MEEIFNNPPSIEESKAYSRERVEAFIASIPRELDKMDDEIELKLRMQNASVKSKLRKIYQLTEQIMTFAKPYTACDKGCSSCCKMNVAISLEEANIIGERLGIKPKLIKSSIDPPNDKYIGVPCVFLKNDACSIYEFRPFLCRNHLNFDKTAYWCHPDRSLSADISKVRIEGINQAYFSLIEGSSGIHADIRDFF